MTGRHARKSNLWGWFILIGMASVSGLIFGLAVVGLITLIRWIPA